MLDLLQRQVDDAKKVLQKGRAFRLIEWSQRNHKRQLGIIRGVLNALEEKLDDELERAVDDGPVQVPRLPPTLTTPDIQSRFHAARRSLPSQKETYSYEKPERPESEPLESSRLDMAGRLRQRLTDLLDGRGPNDPPLEPDQWLESDALPGVAFELAMLSRLEADDGRIHLDDGRTARTSLPDAIHDRLVELVSTYAHRHPDFENWVEARLAAHGGEGTPVDRAEIRRRVDQTVERAADLQSYHRPATLGELDDLRETADAHIEAGSPESAANILAPMAESLLERYHWFDDSHGEVRGPSTGSHRNWARPSMTPTG